MLSLIALVLVQIKAEGEMMTILLRQSEKKGGVTELKIKLIFTCKFRSNFLKTNKHRQKQTNTDKN